MDNLTTFKIYDISQDFLTLLSELQNFGLIPQQGDYNCPKCSGALQFAPDNSCSTFADPIYWTCRSKVSLRKQKTQNCNTRISIRTNTFFDNSKLPIFKILAFSHFWVNKLPLDYITKELHIASETAVKLTSLCREVVFDSYITNPQKIGGPGRIVEIDESKFGKRKYHRGHRVEGQWVFGGFERDSGNVFMVAVEDRKTDTLLPIINNWVLPGTTIISDCWKECLSKQGYDNLTVNHNINFKDPETGVHTNSIESSWRHAKSSKSTSGGHEVHIPEDLARYMFQKKCKYFNLDATREFYKLAGNLYNPVTKRVMPFPQELLAESDLEGEDFLN